MRSSFHGHLKLDTETRKSTKIIWKYRSGSLEVPDLSWLIAIFQNIHLKPNMLASMIFMIMDTKNIGSDLASLQKTGCYIP